MFYLCAVWFYTFIQHHFWCDICPNHHGKMCPKIKWNTIKTKANWRQRCVALACNILEKQNKWILIWNVILKSKLGHGHSLTTCLAVLLHVLRKHASFVCYSLYKSMKKVVIFFFFFQRHQVRKADCFFRLIPSYSYWWRSGWLSIAELPWCGIYLAPKLPAQPKISTSQRSGREPRRKKIYDIAFNQISSICLGWPNSLTGAESSCYCAHPP